MAHWSRVTSCMALEYLHSAITFDWILAVRYLLRPVWPDASPFAVFFRDSANFMRYVQGSDR